MPIYLFRYPGTDIVIEEVQKMMDEHVYVDEDGVEWERVFTAPNASIDSNIDPFSAQDFVNKTKSMKGSVGDIWDYSKELSQKRKHKEGSDSIKNSYDSRRETKLKEARKRNMRKQTKKEIVRREKAAKKKK